MYDSLFSPASVLNEQVAREVFDILPENGPLMLIIDKDGHFWPSSSERFTESNISPALIKEICSRIDDGSEPTNTNAGDMTVIGSSISTGKTNCGYVLIAEEKKKLQTTAINFDLSEFTLNLVCLVAKLIEKNTLLYELQVRQYSTCSQDSALSN